VSCCIATALAQAFAWASDDWDHGHFFTWSPPGPGDVRAPCPMLNTLANHGFLPHNGQNITEFDTINALYTALNVNQTLGEFLFKAALTTNPTPNATTFSLDNLSRHNILEHDASLSRGDFYFGDDHTFNQTIFDQTRSYWTAPVVDVQMAANARLARVHTSNATNPTFTLTTTGREFSFGESAAYILVLGDRVTGTVTRSWVEYLFEHERLPLQLGWKRRREIISTSDLITLLERVVNATVGSFSEADVKISARDFHAGI